jgi:hypothetical protein
MNTSTPRLIAKAAGLKKYVGQPCIHGHTGERWVRNNGCVECHAKTKHVVTYKKRGRPRKHELFIGPPRLKRVTFKPETEIDRWIVRSKGNKKAKLRKGLSIADYKALVVTHCPLLGVELNYTKYSGNTAPNNYATLDKIDPDKGYVLGNVQIVSFRANTLKNSATLEELKLIVKNWYNGKK